MSSVDVLPIMQMFVHPKNSAGLITYDSLLGNDSFDSNSYDSFWVSVVYLNHFPQALVHKARSCSEPSRFISILSTCCTASSALFEAHGRTHEFCSLKSNEIQLFVSHQPTLALKFYLALNFRSPGLKLTRNHTMSPTLQDSRRRDS